MKKISKKQFLRGALYILLPIAVVVLGIVSGEKWYLTATSALAVVYLLMLSDGIRFSYILCALYGFSYGAASFRVGLYAGGVYHIFVLAPVALYRFFAAKKPNGGVIRSLNPGKWCFCFVGIAAASAGLYFLLKALGGAQPALDALTLAVSVVTALLMSKNYREIWYFNLFSSLLYIAVWTVTFVLERTGLTVVFLQCVVSFINIRGIVKWRKMSERDRT